MRVYQVRPFEPHHYIMIKDELESSFGISRIQLDSERIAKNFANNGNLGRSGFCDGELLVCAGILVPWAGNGVAWALLSGNAKKHPYFVHRAVIEGLVYFANTFKLRRIEANVDDSMEPAKRWAKHLGFIEESIMPNYGPKGETFVKYVILK